MPQQRQQQCGCIDNFMSGTIFTELCPGHLNALNNQERRQQQDTTQPRMQTSTTIPGIPLSPFSQFQMGGFGHPFQMPPQGVHIRIPQQGTGR